MNCICDEVGHCLTCPHVQGDTLRLRHSLLAHSCASCIFARALYVCGYIVKDRRGCRSHAVQSVEFNLDGDRRLHTLEWNLLSC